MRRGRNRVEFTQMPNAVVRDYRLTWRARGLLIELLSYPPGYEITIDDLVVRAKRVNPDVEGRDAMRKAQRELKNIGYIVTRRGQDARGRWWTELEITDEPLLQFALQAAADEGLGTTMSDDAASPGTGTVGDAVSAGRTDDGFPGVGSPGVGSPGVGSPGVGAPVVGSSGVNKKTDPKTEKKKDPKNERSLPPNPPGSNASRRDGGDTPPPAPGQGTDEFLPPARDLLARLRGRDPRLTLGADQVDALAPGVASWLQAGHPAAAIEAVLTEGDWSPAATKSVIGTLRWRLQHREPPARPVRPPAEPAYRAPPGPAASCGSGPADSPEVAQDLARVRDDLARIREQARGRAGGPPPLQPGAAVGEYPP
jgi:hypothetical protein